MHTRRKFGRSPVGTRARKVMVGYKNRNTTVIAAISPARGLIAWTSHVGGTNTAVFIEFMKQLSKTDMCRGQSNSIVMDNASIHKSPNVQAVFDGMQYVQKVEFITAYSPQLNAIEQCFSKWKAYIKRHNCRNEGGLIKLIEDAANTITKQDCEGWHREVTRQLLACVENQPLC